MRFPIILQHDATDCGPASLAMVASFHKYRPSLAGLREAAGTDRHGTTVAGLITAAETMGYTARAVRATAGSAHQAALPAIAHWREENRSHFVVLYKLTPDSATIGDPAKGLRVIPRTTFHECWSGILVLLTPSPRLRELTKPPSSFLRICGILLPHRRLFLHALSAAVLMTLLSLASSFFIQALVDFVFVLGRKPALNWLTLGLLVALIVRTAFQALRSYLLIHLSLRIDADMVLGFHRHLLGLPLTFFLRRRPGEILSRVNDAVKIRAAVSGTSMAVIVDALLVLTTGSAMAWMNWQLAAATLTLLPLWIALVCLVNRPMKRYQRRAMEKSAEVESHIVETVNAIHTIKSARAEASVQMHTEARFDEMLGANYRAQILGLGSGLASSMAVGLSTVGMLWLGGSKVLAGVLSVGQLMAFYSLLVTILGPVERLSNANQSITDAIVAAERLGEILELETETTQQGANAIDRAISGAIQFENVTCRYGGRAPVVEGFSLNIAAGECVAIGGPSGCGKTTVVQLLARFLEPVGGTIRVDGVDVRDYTFECLRREIACVPQDIVLLNGSIADNIRIARPSATSEEIHMACRSAHLSLSIDTLVGERGTSLSGGERQRVAIARAILADAPVLILDEPVSHLDSESGQAVRELLDKRKGHRTTIVISHRSLPVDRTVYL